MVEIKEIKFRLKFLQTCLLDINCLNCYQQKHLYYYHNNVILLSFQENIYSETL